VCQLSNGQQRRCRSIFTIGGDQVRRLGLVRELVTAGWAITEDHSNHRDALDRKRQMEILHEPHASTLLVVAVGANPNNANAEYAGPGPGTAGAGAMGLEFHSPERREMKREDRPGLRRSVAEMQHRSAWVVPTILSSTANRPKNGRAG